MNGLRRHGFRKVILPTFLALMIYSPLAISGKYPYPEVAEALAQDAIQILINNQKCRDIHECRKNELVFRGGSPEQATLTLFRSGLLDEKTLSEITRACAEAYFREGKKVTVELKAFNEPREDVVGWLSRANPVIHLILKREE